MEMGRDDVGMVIEIGCTREYSGVGFIEFEF